MNNITTTTEIDGVSQELILSITQQYLEQAQVLAPTLSDYSAFARPGFKQVTAPRIGALQAQKKNAATNLNAQAISPGTDTIDLDQDYGVLVEIEDIAAMQSNVDMQAEYVKRMASALALQMDQYIYEQMKLTSSPSPDHRIAFDSGSALTKGDFLNAIELLMAQNVPMNDGQLYVAMSVANYSALLGVADFVDADKWALGASAKLNASLSKIYGFNIVVSNVVDDTGSIFYHRSHVGWARQKQLKLEQQRDIRNLSDIVALSHSYGAKVLDSGKRAVLVGSSS